MERGTPLRDPTQPLPHRHGVKQLSRLAMYNRHASGGEENVNEMTLSHDLLIQGFE